MSLSVTAHEHGRVRVFSLGYRVSMELQHFEAVDRLADALGVESLIAEDVQIVDLSVVRDMGFSAFLMEAYGITEDEMTPLSDTLNALQGHAAVLRSGAFGGTAVVLPGSGEATLVATLHEPRMSAPDLMPSYDSARSGGAGKANKKPISDKAMSGRIAMYALLAVFAFTILFVWIAS
ncbi:MAG: hypothetical protein AAFY25_08540 [Pseudomonadota bacterium]